MPRKLNEIEPKFTRHIKTTQIAVSFDTVVRHLIFHQLELFNNYLLLKLYPLWHILNNHIFSHMVKLYHGNGKTNGNINTASYPPYQREALDTTIVPQCMFKYILSSLTFGDFYYAKAHIVF